MDVDRLAVRRDPRTTYDFTGGEVAVSEPLVGLEDAVSCPVRFDEYTKELYASDASIYAQTPLAVVFPRGTDDIAAVMRYCARHEIPVLPRGGGTSLAGQAVNEAVVLDCTRDMQAVEDVDVDAQECTAQPGITLGLLNEQLEPTGLKFAPDPAWGDKSVLGGAIGNNSTGSHSLAYGKTDAYLESCEVVLADGTVTTVGWCSLETVRERADPHGDLEARLYAMVARCVDEEADAIMDAFPDLHRNVSGYNLDALVSDAEDGRVNVARVVAGSEGTLGIVTRATVSLEPIPETTGVGLLVYDSLQDAMSDVQPILTHDPAAVEVVDDVLLDLARETAEFGEIVQTLPDDCSAVLLVEFYAGSDAEAAADVETLLDDRVGATRAREGYPALDQETQNRFWSLRKSGLPILLGRTSDEKHLAFIEDTAVPAEALADYVADVRDVLAAHDTYASFYAHAGPGCLHIRPLIDAKSAEGVATMEAIADEITDLVIEYGGSVSGEHGDGRARSQWNRKQYGEHVFELFRDLKRACDPDGLLNPGQVCGDVSMTASLRFGPEYDYDPGFEPALQWEIDNGMQGMVELCHGCGGCRGEQSTTGGVMCPTYRASREEVTSTRGRANLLRAAMSGDLPTYAHEDPEFMHEVLDLCIGCKGCKRDCPSEVDFAKLKTEVTYAMQQRDGVDLRTRLFSNVHTIGAIGTRMTPVSNWMLQLPGARWIGERVLGIATERSLPSFASESLLAWDERRTDRLDPVTASDTVVLLPDPIIAYHDVAIGIAAVRVLEAADVAVRFPDEFYPSGRAALSLGRIDVARERATTLMAAMAPAIEGGDSIVCLEPSDAVMLQSDYADLVGGEAVADLSDATYGFFEFIHTQQIDLPVTGEGELTYHGHCHQKAAKRDRHAPAVLAGAGWDVDILDSGCCGMAGAFGYEAEHYSMSRAIGRILEGQVADSDGDIVVAPGASCRTQLAEIDGPVRHPVTVLAETL